MLEVYNANKSLFPSASLNVYTLLSTFCKDTELIKRVELHRQHINKSKLKRQTLLSLYYVELNEQTRQLNFIYKPADQGTNLIAAHFREIKDKEDKAREEEQARQTKLAQSEKKPVRKFDELRLTSLAKPKDKWKVGK